MKISSFLLAGAAASVLAAPAFAADRELMIFDWAGFEIPGLFETYQEKYGNSPSYAFYGDDDEAYQKVASGFRADVVHPCSQMVSKYRDAGLIEPWDVSKIPAFADLDPQFLDSPVFKDETGVWFLPTDWGVTAVAYNPDEVPAEDVSTLQVFLDPKYAGRISLPNSSDDVWALAYLATGVTDWDNVSDEQFQAAADWLRKVHKNVRSYWADPSEQAQLMASGEVLIAWSWNDGVAYLKQDGYPVAFQREPVEGSTTWFCGMVNMKDGPGSEEKVYDFINSWLRPEAALPLIEEIGYGHSNLKGMALIPKEEVIDAGLGPINAPILAQTPNDPQLRERQLAEFEKIKAGF
ncbi:ABC transporter substrate-binding protein [Paenirhodobacter populi]|uniref:Extracellular solute-binding protein n=1 Tax=Paenirhodobacter populi TaxID=2306993 RepID=A0A443KDD9_9RHOB|nr:extracellular solute-binding protein [Sinirhodobacter populi]RWR04970.1 extracellular solute-binding protein [Sinirhodobacter populi]RWR24494.1 extracellular solute-binding protein [Sinirhodobacter populi]RWR29239.1 extracellular solute-binding protein [Sinirhodobacter populi]RWR30613.1 extracellular solute-binding protein [Sinirhodobacter populi]